MLGAVEQERRISGMVLGVSPTASYELKRGNVQLTILLTDIVWLNLGMQLHIKQLGRGRRFKELHKGRDDTLPFGGTEFRNIALEELLKT